MKNQWPFWLFLVVIIVVIIFSLNYQKKAQPVHLGEIFEEGSSRKIDYVYKPDETVPMDAVTQETVAVPVSTDAALAPAAEVKPAPVAVVAEPAPVKPVVQQAVAPKVETVAPATTGYVIQILASKDKPSTDKALERAQKAGFSAAYIQTVALGDKGTWYRIYIGGFKTQAEAQGSLGSVKASYKDAFIRSLK